jgi:hypothetical protein
MNLSQFGSSGFPLDSAGRKAIPDESVNPSLMPTARQFTFAQQAQVPKNSIPLHLRRPMNFRRLNPRRRTSSRRKALKDPKANSILEDVIDFHEFSNLSGGQLNLLLFHVKECIKYPRNGKFVDGRLCMISKNPEVAIGDEITLILMIARYKNRHTRIYGQS